MKTALYTATVLLVFFLVAGCAGEVATIRRGSFMAYPFEKEPQTEEIYHIPTGLQFSFDGMMDIVDAARLTYVGESHTNVHAHRVQLEVLRELERRNPGKIALGMEMFRQPQQESLDRWVSGELTELDFLRASRWYENWGSDFGYYRDIMVFARDRGIDIIALNPSKELQREVAMSAGADLPPELAAQLPKPGPPDPFQRAMLESVFKGHDAGSSAFAAFYDIQLLWEETMAARIVEYLEGPAGDGKKMVVLAGAMHVQYGFGIPKKVLRRYPAPYVIVLPDEISIPEDKREKLLMDVVLPDPPLLRGDFIWLVPYEDLEDNRVLLGVAMASKDGKVLVEKVVPGSIAEKIGIMPGDEIVSLDGRPVEGAGDVVLTVRSKNPGDSLAVTIRRGEELLEFAPRFAVPGED